MQSGRSEKNSKKLRKKTGTPNKMAKNKNFILLMPSTKQEKWKMENQKGKRKCGVGGTLLSC